MALQERAVLVGGGDDLQLAVPDEPAPSRAELLRGGFVELFLEILKAAEVFFDLVGDGALGSPPPFGFMMAQNML